MPNSVKLSCFFLVPVSAYIETVWLFLPMNSYYPDTCYSSQLATILPQIYFSNKKICPKNVYMACKLRQKRVECTVMVCPLFAQ